MSPRQALLLTVGLLSFWMASGYRLAPHARSTDFLNLYTGASFALNGDWHGIYTEEGHSRGNRSSSRSGTICGPSSDRQSTPFSCCHWR